MSTQELTLYWELDKDPLDSFFYTFQGSVELSNCIFSIFSIFLHILIIVIMMTVMKVLISFLPDIGWPWDLFTVSGYLFLVLFMCSGHPWQFCIACWTWRIKNELVDTTHPAVIYSFTEESLSLCSANRGVVESSNPVKTLLKWGWFEALLSLRQSLNCLWPFRVLIWNSGMIFEAPPLLSLKLWIFFSWNCPKALLCLLEIFRLVFQLPVLHSPRI